MAGDSSGLIKVGLVAGAAYLAYSQGWLSFLGIGAAPAAVAPAAPAAPAAPIITGANTVDGVSAKLIQANTGPSSVDEWGYFLNQILSPLGKTAPDPGPIFTAAVPGFDRSQKLTAAQYLAVMGPALKTQLGLAGLGAYAGLAAIAFRRGF